MYYPFDYSAQIKNTEVKAFGGLNRRVYAKNGEFRDMENLLPNDFPCLSSSPLPKLVLEKKNIVKWIIPKYADTDINKFSGVIKEDDGTYSIYINGEEKLSGISNVKDAFDFNGTIITYPDYKGYNYKMVSDDFRAEKKRKFASYTGNIKFETVKSSGKVDHCVITCKGSSKTPFREGDMLAISGCGNEKKNTIYPQHSADYSNEENPVTITVISTSDATTGFTINVHVYNVNGELIGFDTDTANDSGTISLYYPIMDFACAHKNRVWGLGASGESIYASELGSPDHFGTMGTNAVDAWYGDVGTPGKFTGMSTYQDRVLAFKEDELHIVYGDMPENYTIFRNYSIGCIDGRSVVSMGNQVIWLYHDGFYSYSGGKPSRISDALNTKYTSCIAFSDNKRYYARCEKEDGTFEMLVYDTEYGLWNKLSDCELYGGEYFGGIVYTYNPNGVYELFGGEHGDFYGETAPMTFDTYKDKSVLYLYVRAIIGPPQSTASTAPPEVEPVDGVSTTVTAPPEGEPVAEPASFLNVYTSVNNGEWVAHKGISESGKTKLPVRYSKGDTLRIRFEGCGKVTIIDLGMEIIKN